MARHVVRLWLLSALGAALTAIGARITIPWWPVPATLQVFFVLLSGVALGRRWGAAAQAQYVAAGALGLPIFAGGRAGAAALLGPTGGYIVGFIAAAYVTGWLTEVWRTEARRKAPLASATETDTATARDDRARGLGPYMATLVGAAVIWLFGWAWLAAWAAAGSEAAPLRAAFAWGVVPFIALDALKAIAAAAAGRLLVRDTGAQQ